MPVLVSILIWLSLSTQHHRLIPPGPVLEMFTLRSNHNMWQKQMQIYLRSIPANKYVDLIYNLLAGDASDMAEDSRAPGKEVATATFTQLRQLIGSLKLALECLREFHDGRLFPDEKACANLQAPRRLAERGFAGESARGPRKKQPRTTTRRGVLY
ncbi:hypothetical protein D915_008896 [Fasciola hepatica]|uniref:Uncharacterized protein n=1 Tax=Fasciola hepatica TaxID=6192 RepID=A0A4E0R4U1_FASHE|nr:hypothetical protein D915_008896 [Fasciola hepatica]